jgi:hypothetical protein
MTPIKNKHSPRKMLDIELASINLALREGRRIAEQHGVDLEHFRSAEAAISKIRKIGNQLVKERDEARYDGMREQRKVDAMLGRRTS